VEDPFPVSPTDFEDKDMNPRFVDAATYAAGEGIMAWMGAPTPENRVEWETQYNFLRRAAVKAVMTIHERGDSDDTDLALVTAQDALKHMMEEMRGSGVTDPPPLDAAAQLLHYVLRRRARTVRRTPRRRRRGPCRR
jgi:hypothetical protein